MKPRSPETLRQAPLSDLISCWFLATGALCIGLLANQLRDTPLPLNYQSKAQRLGEAVDRLSDDSGGDKPADSRSSADFRQELNLEEFRGFISGNHGIIIDARPEIFHRLGHVPGAIALPRDDFESRYRLHASRLEGAKDHPLVIYCSGPACEDAELVGTALRKLGFRQIAIFRGGWEEWQREGLPEEASL